MGNAPNKPLRLTFNKPAIVQLIKGEDEADGLRVRIDNGVVQFQPVVGSTDDDVLPLDFRERGGAKAIVEGSMANDLAAALVNDAGPFFVLQRKNGWITAKRHPESEAPSKFVAHLRVWDSEGVNTKAPKQKAVRATRTTTKAPKTASEQPISLSVFLDQVKNARNLIAENSAVKRPGRPSRELAEAKSAMASFEQLAMEALPTFTKVREAHAILSELLAPETKAKHIEEAPQAEPIAEIAPVAANDAVTTDSNDRRRRKAGEPRRRGRPLGSKNKPKVQAN